MHECTNGFATPLRSCIRAFVHSSPSLRLRQHHPERRPDAWGRLYFNFAIVHLYCAIHHREAYSASLFLRREIQVEDALEMLGGDADACVRERDRDEGA